MSLARSVTYITSAELLKLTEPLAGRNAAKLVAQIATEMLGGKAKTG